ncbi:hypothetical protein Pmani_035142 [Petrolisthes manimaculis]|uniref:Uncharacterized protein n=1 Tax=Petrolisthes manimaculis TaxID=1843537 RepID=A0AAE1NNG2_9EUCA|nr:hypothetical protein Pmani_035142 [Petrolisthes manimaculis]
MTTEETVSVTRQQTSSTQEVTVPWRKERSQKDKAKQSVKTSDVLVKRKEDEERLREENRIRDEQIRMMQERKLEEKRKKASSSGSSSRKNDTSQSVTDIRQQKNVSKERRTQNPMTGAEKRRSEGAIISSGDDEGSGVLTVSKSDVQVVARAEEEEDGWKRERGRGEGNGG